MTNYSDRLVSFIWDVADLLRGPYRPPEYRKVMLPMTVLRRLDCVLESTKDKVLDENKRLKGQNATLVDKMLRRAAKQQFYNTSKYNFSKLLDDPEGLAQNLLHYIHAFSPETRALFDNFGFDQQIQKLDKSNRLFKLVQKFAEADLHPNVVSNLEMGRTFEELVRKFNEAANEEAGDHFTPREVIRLMVDLLFLPDNDLLRKKGAVRTLFDPAAGTGGMLSEAAKYMRELNPDAKLVIFGQDYNAEAYAICGSDMLIKGEEIDKIQLGDSLGDGKTFDAFPGKKFDYIGLTYFEENDVIVAKITPCFENGKCAIAGSVPGGSALGTTELHVIRPRRDVIPEFVFYTCISDFFRQAGEAQMFGAAGQKRVPTDFIKDFPLSYPEERAQQLLSNFLDRETHKIAQLIAKKQRLIELLDEKRAALISRAVTQGLDPNVPMKDSGVEWLGRVPRHWEIVRLRHLSPRIGVGLVINPSTYTCTEGVPFIFGANILEFGISLGGVRMISVSDSRSLPASMLQAGDLVTVRVGYPGVTAVVPEELEGANCASVMIVRKGLKFVSEWLCYAMNSRIGRDQVARVKYGAAQEQFNIRDAVDFRFPVPPLNEQNSIAKILTQSLTRITASVDRNRRSMDLLREYRSALITAVTGQLDIREHEKKVEAIAS